MPEHLRLKSHRRGAIQPRGDDSVPAEVHRVTKGRIAWATAFDARAFESRDLAGRVIAGLSANRLTGAP